MMGGGGFSASIPNSMKKTIQNIKEITGNHSEEDIYAMLKECSMDPNETTQKLLRQDTFHEVKRKRDRRKENLNSRESAESCCKSSTQGRGDAGGGKGSLPGKDNGTHQVVEKGRPSLLASQETKDKVRKSGTSSVPIVSHGPSTLSSGISNMNISSSSLAVCNDSASSYSFCAYNSRGSLLSISPNKGDTFAFEREELHDQSISSFSIAVSRPSSSSAVCFSSSDPVLVLSNDIRCPGDVGTIKCEMRSQRTLGEPNTIHYADNESASDSEIGYSSSHGKILGKPHEVLKNQMTESSQTSSAVTHGICSGSRPSSNYSSRSQQTIGPQKEMWKPKPTNTTIQRCGSAGTSEIIPTSAETTCQSQSVSTVLGLEEATSELHKKLEELHIPQRQHVILPNHMFLPDSEKTKFHFGSLGASFEVTTDYVSSLDNGKTPTLSETSQVIEETLGVETSSNQNDLVTTDVGDYPDHPKSPTCVPENLSSGEVDVSNTNQEHNESKHETLLSTGGHQCSVVHTSPNYNFYFVPPMLGNQLAPLENLDSQARDISHLSSFVVHQPFDLTGYYAQFYRSGADTDGWLSPFPNSGVSTKYNGNVAVMSAPNSHSLQEGAILSTAGPTPLKTQAAGLMQSSIAVTQQPVPVFRPPTGVHISHYPPNYLPYSHYISPFYVPPPAAIHQFLGNSAFTQQPQASTLYPPPPAAAAVMGVKYPLPQYKPGSNAGNPTHIVMPSSYGAYGSSPAGYNPNSATAGNSTTDEDLTASQFKESNACIIAQQQSEGSGVWVAAPGREPPNLPNSSYQHVTFSPTQAGQGTFTGIYHHPAQAVTAATVHPLLQQSQTVAGSIDMVGPGGNVYQQPQHAQVNWPSSY